MAIEVCLICDLCGERFDETTEPDCATTPLYRAAREAGWRCECTGDFCAECRMDEDDAE